MTFRRRVADWISGGEISAYQKQAETEISRSIKYMDGLFDIIEMETLHPNSTVKRMVSRAREALK